MPVNGHYLVVESTQEKRWSRLQYGKCTKKLVWLWEHTHIIGRLDDFTTRSGYVMTPIVFWAGKLPTLDLNDEEVDSVHRIPVTEFARQDAPMLSESSHGDAPVLRMPIGDTWIAAPTAAVLLQFREVCMLGKNTRVAHYDQPEFAWK